MTLEHRICRALAEHECQRGSKADVIYVGRVEHAQIQAAAREHGVVRDPKIESTRTEYLGRRIYEVDAETYLDVGRRLIPLDN
jgi:hypothetical protein